MKTILLHGLGQTASSWTTVMDRMGGGADILAPDLFGLLGGRAVNYPNLYQAFSEFCMAQPGPVQLGGLSLGGVLALNFGIEHPDKVGALALIGTQFAMPKGLLKVQNMVFRVMPDRLFRDMGLEKRDMITLSKSMMDLDFRRELDKISCPALIVCGEKDRANKQAAQQLAQYLPRASLSMVGDAGHEVNVDAPEALAALLNDFFCKL